MTETEVVFKSSLSTAPRRPAAETLSPPPLYLDALCPVCDHRGLEFLPPFAGRHGRILAVCRGCGHVYES
jgi:hypothetical protein